MHYITTCLELLLLHLLKSYRMCQQLYIRKYRELSDYIEIWPYSTDPKSINIHAMFYWKESIGIWSALKGLSTKEMNWPFMCSLKGIFNATFISVQTRITLIWNEKCLCKYTARPKIIRYVQTNLYQGVVLTRLGTF